MNEIFRTIVVEQEPGSGGKESAEFSVRQLAGYHVRVDRVTGAKELRAQPLADQCEAGNVRLVRGQWNYRFIAGRVLGTCVEH